MHTKKKRLLSLPILLLAMASCQCLPPANTTIPERIPVQRAVLLTVEIEEEYTDGVFLLMEEWGKVQINTARLQEEIDLLRIELSKFE